jgi:hypothetical protein
MTYLTINKASTPIIFADDNSILFAHSSSSLIDFNKNITKFFVTLNKWIRAILVRQIMYTLQLTDTNCQSTEK